MANNRFFQRYIFPNIPGKWDQEERRFAAGLREIFDALFARERKEDDTGAVTDAKLDYLYMMAEIEYPAESADEVQKAAGYYRKGLWNIQMVWDAVGKWITAEDYEEITGEQMTWTRPE